MENVMGKPKKPKLRIEESEPKKRKTTHGAVCPKCSSDDVRIVNTITQPRAHPPHLNRLLRRRRRLICQACLHSWWQTLRLEETIVED